MKKSAAKCLVEFITQSEAACTQAVESKAMVHIANLLNSTITIDLRWVLVKILTCCAKYDSMKSLFMTEEMATGLQFTLKISMNCYMFLTDVLTCLGLYLSEYPVQLIMLSQNISFTWKHCLFTPDTVPLIVRTKTVDLIIKCAPYPMITDKFIEDNILQKYNHLKL